MLIGVPPAAIVAAEPGLPEAPPATVLHPGDVCSGERGDRYATLLGSCVSIMLADPRGTVGAMCHFVIAGARRAGLPADTRRAGDALDAMFQALRERAIQPHLCLAHLAGGGNMFPDRCGSDTGGDVGATNARAALALMEAHGIAVASRSLGDACYRKVAWTIGSPEPVVECYAV